MWKYCACFASRDRGIEDAERATDKLFQISVRVSLRKNPALPPLQHPKPATRVQFRFGAVLHHSITPRGRIRGRGRFGAPGEHLQPAARVQFREGASYRIDTPFLQATTFEHEHERRTPNAKREAPGEGGPFLATVPKSKLIQGLITGGEHYHRRVWWPGFSVSISERPVRRLIDLSAASPENEKNYRKQNRSCVFQP